MKRSVALEAIKEASAVTLIVALDPELVGAEYSEKTKAYNKMLQEEHNTSLFDSCSVMAEVSVDALEKAGMIFDPE